MQKNGKQEVLHKEAQQTNKKMHIYRWSQMFQCQIDPSIVHYDILKIIQKHLHKIIKILCSSSYFVLLKFVFLALKSVSPLHSWHLWWEYHLIQRERIPEWSPRVLLCWQTLGQECARWSHLVILFLLWRIHICMFPLEERRSVDR